MNYKLSSQTGMHSRAGTNLQQPDAQCITTISTIVIQNNLKLPSSLKSNVDAECRLNKCMDNFFLIVLTIQFFGFSCEEVLLSPYLCPL